MNAVLVKYPHLACKIFEKLDNISLLKASNVNDYWNIFIEGQRDIWYRLIQQNINCPSAIMKVTFPIETRTEDVKTVAIQINDLFFKFNERTQKDCTVKFLSKDIGTHL